MANFTITWIPTSTEFSVDQVVQYKKSSSTIWISHATVGKTISTSVVTGLLNNTIYDFRIIGNCKYNGPNVSNSLTLINFLCPTLTLTSTATSVNYTFPHPGNSISETTVKLYESNGTTLLNTQTPVVSSVVTGSFTGLVTSGNTYKVMLNIKAGPYTTDCLLQSVVGCPVITFTNTVVSPNVILGNTYSLNAGATVTSGILTYTITPALPSGLTLNTTTGMITGTPTTTLVNTTYVVTAQTSTGCSNTQSYTFAVICPTLVFTNTNVVLSNATVGTFYSLNTGVTGNTQPVVFSVSPALPAGLTINTNTGLISGTPTVAASLTPYSVTATQGLCASTRNYSFSVVNVVCNNPSNLAATIV